MSYHQEIAHHINSVIVGGGYQFAAQSDSGVLEVDMPSADTLAVSFESFLFKSDRLSNSDTGHLGRIADRLASKLSYLLEPLRVIEIDGEAGAVQMRSHPPYQRESQTRYYEVLVQRGGSLSLGRYERLPGQPRRSIPATVTHEVFYRLADDFAAAVG